jgi:predicted Zn-ribbon and HTH transcriptional regulator
MGRVPITLMGYQCERCGHEWISKIQTKEPRVCPKCKSPYWDQPKKQIPISYEMFRDQIRSILKESKTPLTWTEIRTRAKLGQRFPNNVWVHRMDKDIGLLRIKDKHGIIHWQLASK